MTQTDIEARQLVEAVRERVAEESLSAWTPAPHARREGDVDTLPPMRHHGALDYLHRNWAIRDTVPPVSVRVAARRGPRALARALANRAVRSSLAPYMEAEQELMAHVVRLCDAMAKRCDALAEADTDCVEEVRTDLIDLATHVQSSIDRLVRASGRSLS
jgi:hypothetical protein